MAKEKNQPVAKVECPFKGCTRQVPVFRFRARTDSEDYRRFAGKHYGRCETHGEFKDNEYILENAHSWANDPATAAAPKPPAAPTPAPATPTPSPAQPQKTPVKVTPASPTPAPKKDGGLFL